ncbi:DedA family protein [Sulfuricurvum sp. IAE1]|jgi:membrane protein DedA with SNARE-associated domain|uniref:DedA family protein n=1 Tax=Sulfuricurvum sp. IAE1 TaxID=2546102 RepID=UPI0010517B4B|nr:DedA family protein [Sulfuricurvum sp. IAE1]MDD3769345.1 DedA family protein [Sulfuricurvum sp.]MDX9966275.1 DedA family protein [Sulfuricurvum sp.]TDA68988.1 DedA family protein [Sulfuricurvum sp. IAE1]
MEALLLDLLKEYGYVILFLWSILEGEMGLIMGGIMSHTGDMWLPMAIFVAGIGGFVGDQIYFYIGRFNKSYIHEKLRSQRRKFAIAHLLLKKYGWPIIFVQRYLYGLRTVIPMSIGLTKYSSRKFAFINLISAWMWAALTIIPAYYYGEELLNLIHWMKAHWYIALPMLLSIAGGILYYLNRLEKKLLEKRHDRQTR